MDTQTVEPVGTANQSTLNEDYPILFDPIDGLAE